MTMVGALVGCNGGLASMRENSHFFRQAGSEMVSLHLEVVASLQIQPEPITCAEIPREPQSAIRADGPGAMHDLVNPPRRHTDISGQPVLRQAKRFEEILREDFAGVYGFQLSSGHATPSSDTLVIVDDRNFVGIPILPAKADAPLLVHADTVLAGSIASKLLQSISWRDAKVAELFGRVHGHQFAQHRALELRRISLDGLASEQSLGIAIGEGKNHEEE